jgi:hypothetical protein
MSKKTDSPATFTLIMDIEDVMLNMEEIQNLIEQARGFGTIKLAKIDNMPSTYVIEKWD